MQSEMVEKFGGVGVGPRGVGCGGGGGHESIHLNGTLAAYCLDATYN